MKNTKLGVGAIIIVVLAGIILWGIGTRNKLVKMDESVTEQWSQVETAYQHRMDLVKQLVSIVQGDANYERGTLEAVIKARSEAGSIHLDGEDLTEEKIAAFQKAQDNLQSAMTRAITLTVERYPELQATQAFRDLMVADEGCENRINVERQKFNKQVSTFNKAIRVFPNNMIASMCGMDKKGYFHSKEEAADAPEINFDL